MDANLCLEFKELINDALGSCEKLPHSLTTSVYDTAWISCVTKNGQWCFPRSFSYIIDSQLESGLWSYNSQLSSSILNSLGGLFALVEHEKKESTEDLRRRIRIAESALRDALQSWSIEDAQGVGFEMLIPTMLECLEKNDIELDFPAKSALIQMRNMKMALLKPETLYDCPSTLLHSLEVFYLNNSFSFDLVGKNKVQRSMMASPSATAAYLMRCSCWDTEAEAYLHDVIKKSSGKENGAVPSAFPSVLFETTWMVTTLLTAGFESKSIPKLALERILGILSESGASRGYCVGFAHGIEPDLDDSAESSLTLNLLGKKGLSPQILECFETSTHFKTYSKERDPSFSANCNALHALVTDMPYQSLNITKSMAAIEKITHFLCGQWWNAEKFPIDKWNMSPYYSAMLMCRAFCELLKFLDQQQEHKFSNPRTVKNIHLTLIQCVTRLLQKQAKEGSWGELGVYEETAYAIIALVNTAAVYSFEIFEESLNEAVRAGRKFLASSAHSPQPDLLWVEKVSFGSSLLSRSYALAALRIPRSHTKIGTRMLVRHDITFLRTNPLSKTFKRLPMTTCCPEWLITSSQMEATIFLELLQDLREDVFKRQGFTEDKYFKWIPSIWTLANNTSATHMSPAFLLDMMMLSFINFQVDEYMESAVADTQTSDLKGIELFIASHPALADCNLQTTDKYCHNLHQVKPNGDSTLVENASLEQIFQTLTKYIEYVTHHHGIQKASERDKKYLKMELGDFLIAHLTQARDNHSLQIEKKILTEDMDIPIIFNRATQDFQSWVRGTASKHTSCPYSFTFAGCLLSAQGQDFFPSTREKYIATDICHHLATVCRIYNDCGSLARDIKEGNLNCVNFPEIWSGVNHHEHDVVSELRDQIFDLATYERAMLNASLKHMMEISDKKINRMLRLFVTVTDMFGEVYLLRDLASWRKSQT